MLYNMDFQLIEHIGLRGTDSTQGNSNINQVLSTKSAARSQRRPAGPRK